MEQWLRDEEAPPWDCGGITSSATEYTKAHFLFLLIFSSIKWGVHGVFELAILQNHMGKLKTRTWFLNHNPRYTHCDSLSLERTLPAPSLSKSEAGIPLWACSSKCSITAVWLFMFPLDWQSPRVSFLDTPRQPVLAQILIEPFDPRCMQ